MAIGVKVVKGSAQNARKRRHFRVRKRVVGSAERPRLVVSRSSRHLVAQIVDDSIGQTLSQHQPWRAPCVNLRMIRVQRLVRLA